MLENCYGQHGWKEFYRNRQDILEEFDKILEKNANRPVKVAHGQGVEAYFRKWLAEFLPKKYGVTSGFIIPNIYNDTGLIYHFDIIIYNQLESPILWTDGNEDQSDQGKYRAIPAKHVVAVYEVKSRLTKKNIKDSITKLNQTESFKDQLNPVYSCGIIFIELKRKDENKKSILEELATGRDIPGYVGGMVLRYEGDHSCTGLIQLFNNDSDESNKNEHLTPLAKPIDDLKIYLKEDGNLEVGAGTSVKMIYTSNNSWSVSKGYSVIFTEGKNDLHLSWSRSYFADFCIDLISRLEGIPFNDKNKPSFGQIFDKIERKQTPLQSSSPISGQPYLEISLYEGGEHGDTLIIDDQDSTIQIIIQIQNIGDSEAVISDDGFKSTCLLAPNKTAVRPLKLIAELKKENETLEGLLAKEPFEIPYRVVYHRVTTESEKDFIAIEINFKVSKDSVSILS